LLDATLSVGASNVLNPERKWGYFPALSASWIVSNEAFAKSIDAINYMKVYASYGMTGNDNLPFDLHKLEYMSGGSYLFGKNFAGAGTLMHGNLPVSNLTYHKTRNINLGLEATFCNRVNLSVDVFNIRKFDQLISGSHVISSVLGVNPGMSNSGEFDYKGIEVELGYHGQSGELKYGANGQFTFSKSKVVNINEQYWKNDFNKRTGQSVGQIFGYEALGFFADQADIANSPKHTFFEVKPGDVKYKDQDGNNIIDEYDQVAIGHSSYMPEMNFSLDLNLEYRNIGLNVLLQGVANYSTILSTPSLYRPLVGNKNISQHYYNNRWTAENQDALYPRLTTLANANNVKNSNIWLQDLSYLKLRTVEIYYNLPKTLVGKLKLSNAQIFARGYNLFSLDKMNVGDPEAYGVNYPMYRSVNVGMKINF